MSDDHDLDLKKDLDSDTLAAEPQVQYDAKLREVEKPAFSKFSSTLAVLVSAFALFSDGYNIQIIGYITPILAKLYPQAVTATMKTRLSNSILIGDIFGMIIFGCCSDLLGRRLGVIACTFFLVLGVTIATASHGTSPNGMLWMMVIGRGVAGVGAGGEYSVCTASAVEAADENDYVRKRRGFLVALSSNGAIISGFVCSSIVSVAVIAIYKNKPSDGIWRICFGIGAVMPLIIFFFRMRIMNSTQYQKHAIQNRKAFPYKLAIRRYWKPFLGCAGAWFLYDVIIYPFNLLAPTIVSTFGTNQTLTQSTGYSALVNAFALPGAIFGGLLIDRIGSRQTYALGFTIAGVLGMIIGGAMIELRKEGTGRFAAFVVLFGLFQSMLAVGPGNCNFLVSSETFPTPIRGHFLGAAAAIGKAGAAVGTQVFPLIVTSFPTTIKGQQAIFLIGSAIAFCGAACVYFLVPDRKFTLEEEDEAFKAYLEENGWDTEGMMGLEKKVAA